MAQEIKGIKGSEMIKDTVIEIQEEVAQEKKRKHKITTAFPAELVEGMMIHCLQQLVDSMNSLFLIFNDKETQQLDSFNTAAKKLEAIKGVHLIFLSELETVTHCLKPYHKASLKPKHRALKEVAAEGFNRLFNMGKDLQKAKRMNHFSVTSFAKEMTLFITNFHVCLHEKTPAKQRRRVVKEYCNEEGL